MPAPEDAASASEKITFADAKLEDFTLHQTLGTGTFGRVKLCEMAATKQFCALKILSKTEVIRLKQQEHIRSERHILLQVDHPFIVKLYNTFESAENLYLLLEYVYGGEVFSHLRQAGRFSKEYCKFYSGQIVLVLKYLHGLNIVFRDLKPENLLISSNGYIKITDFGFAKELSEDTWTLCGTPEYLAPEIIQSKGHGLGVDWWALGILMFEMLCGYPPFFDDNPFGIYQKILIGKIEFPKYFDDYGKDLVKRLLTADKTQRLGSTPKDGANDIWCHKFFRGVDWHALAAGRIQAPIVPQVTSPLDTHYFEAYPEEEEPRPACEISEADKILFREFA